MQSFIDTDKLISIHSSRLKPFFHDQKYHISPLETAATDDQKYAIDYISAHRGDPSDVHSFEFLIHWLGYDISEATWQPYATIADTAALDSYLLSHIEQHPNLIVFIPKADRPPYAFAKACSMSAMISSICSMPIDSRTKSGVTPVANCSSGDNC